MLRLFESAAEAALVRRAQAGQREAFAVLAERYLPLVHSLALAHTGRIHDADDIAQETFLRALERLASLREPRRFSQWLAAIARNLAMDAHRERARIAPGAVPETAVEPAYDRAEIHALVHEKLDALDPPSREILWLHYYGGYSVRAAAGHLGIQTEAAKKRLQRARAALGAEIMTSLAPDAALWIAKRQLVLAAVAKAPSPEIVATAQTGVAMALPLTAKLAAGLAATGAVVTATLFAAMPDAPPAPTPTIAQAPAASSAEPAPPPPAPIPATAAALASSPTVIEVVENEPAAPAAAGSTVRVSGKVVDRRGLPIPGVRINDLYFEFEPGSSSSKPAQIMNSTVSGVDGAYSIEVGNGISRALALENGHGFKERSHHHLINSSEPRNDLDFILEGEYAHRIEGVVLAPDGTPSPDVSVAGKEPKCFAKTDEHGRFALLGLELGERPALSAEKRGFGYVVFGNVAAGTYDVVIQLGAPNSIAGRVIYPDGSPVTEFEIFPHSHTDPDPTRRRDGWVSIRDPEGRFLVERLTGEYMGVTAWTPGYARTGVRHEFRPGQFIEDVVIRLTPQSRLVGRITTPDGNPIEGAAVCTTADSPLHALNERLDQGAPAITDADGRYALGNLAAGTLRFKAAAPGKKSKFQVIALAEASDTVIDWVMAPGGSITVRLLMNGKPAAGKVTISNRRHSRMASSQFPIASFDGSRRYCVLDRSAPDGLIEFEDLPEDTYYVRARLLDESAAAAVQQFGGLDMSEHLPGVQSFSVTLGPGEAVVKDFEFGGEAVIVGTVFHGAAPIEAANVTAWIDSDGVERMMQSQTDAQGRYRFDAVPAGRIRLTAGYALQDGDDIRIPRHFHLERGQTHAEDFDGAQLGTLVATCAEAIGQDHAMALALFPGAEIPVERRVAGQWGVAAQFSIIKELGVLGNIGFGAISRPRLEAGAYRLVAVGQRGALIAGPVDIEIRPGETTRVEF